MNILLVVTKEKAMEEFHHKNGQCEQCGWAIEEVGWLQIINFWESINSKLVPYYLYVCDTCFESRSWWCKNIFPDYCEICNEAIEDGDHHLEKEWNQKNEKIASLGQEHKEKCKVICYKCYNSCSKTKNLLK